MDVTYQGENLKGEEHSFVLEVSEEEAARWAHKWRREEERRAKRIAAEMAACPYVACTCGHHE